MSVTEAAAAPDAVLTDASPDRLAVLEETIARGLASWIDTGRALAEVRDSWLFLATHETFTAYCSERWAITLQGAYYRISASQCADAIVAGGGVLPGGLAANAMRPLLPLLTGQDAHAVGEAWGRVMERHEGREKPPSERDVQAVLADAGLATTKPQKPQPVRLVAIGRGVRTVADRVTRLAVDLDGRPLPPSAREQAAEIAGIARQVVAGLDALADGSTAARQLAALESPRVAAGELCLNHGERRLSNGWCADCQRPDLSSKARAGVAA